MPASATPANSGCNWLTRPNPSIKFLGILGGIGLLSPMTEH
jgi:hypothetical protein